MTEEVPTRRRKIVFVLGVTAVFLLLLTSLLLRDGFLQSGESGRTKVLSDVVRIGSLGFEFRLPPGYRVARFLNQPSQFLNPGGVDFHVTKAPESEEREFVREIEARVQRGEDFGIEESVAFVPGSTIAFRMVSRGSFEEEEQFLVQNSEEALTVFNPFLMGTRYRRVRCCSDEPDEALFRLPSGEGVLVVLGYPFLNFNLDEEGFDEEAFRIVVTSLRPL